jgi:hypothetical protein
LTRASRAKRLAVKAIAGSKKAYRRADRLELIRHYQELFTRFSEIAQAYGHRDAEGCVTAAPYTTEQQIAVDAAVAAACNQYIEKHCPHAPRRVDAGGPCGSLRLVEKGEAITSVPLEGARNPLLELHFDVPHEAARKPAAGRDMPELTEAEFQDIMVFLYYQSMFPVDAAAFRAKAGVTWERSLRHRKVGIKVKGDLIERDRLDELAGNQSKEFWRLKQRVRPIFDMQVRVEEALGWRRRPPGASFGEK